MREEEFESMSEDEFLEYLWHPDIRKTYIKEYKSRSRVIKREFKSKREYLTEKFKAHIEEDKQHSSIFNMCISPFIGEGSLVNTGYKFIRAAPLLELGLPNMDFLLFKKDDKCNIAIFGECKGSISSPSSVISELNKRKNTIIENIDYIKNNYLGALESTRLHLEYVLAVSGEDAGRMLTDIIDAGGDFILWQTALTRNAEVRCLEPPRKSMISREKMIHIDHDLRDSLDQDNPAQSLKNMFFYFPQSHIFIKLYALLYTSYRQENPGRTFTRNDLREVVSKEIFYMSDAKIDSEIDILISKGLEINFLEDLNPDEGYKIAAQGRFIDLERQLEKNWIASQLDKELERELHIAQISLRSKFVVMRKKRPILSDYSV